MGRWMRGAMISPRVAPQMIGLGLLEAVPEADVLALADPGDADGDGISGRPNRVWSESTGQPMLGRFGSKAGQATIRDQSASAFSADVGISTSLHRDPAGDCTPGQTALPRPAGRRRAGGRRPGAGSGDLLRPQPGGAGAARSRRRGGAGGQAGLLRRWAARAATTRSSSPTGLRASRSRASS